MNKTHLTGSVALMATLALLVGCGKKDDGAQQPDGVPEPNPQQKRPPLGEPKYRVTVDQLAKEFSEKKDAGLVQYDGAVVEVTGTASDYPSISPGWERGGGTDAEILAGYSGWVQLRGDTKTVTADLASFIVGCKQLDRSIFEKIHSGQLVVVKGRMKANGTLFSEVQDCELVKVGPETGIRTSAKDLAKEAKSLSSDTLRAKYFGKEVFSKPKTVILTGTVAKSVVASGSVLVELDGADGFRLSCDLGGNAEYLFKNGFPAGEVVTFACKLAYDQNELKAGILKMTWCIPTHRGPTMSDLIGPR